jgi:hypothetical protein
MVQAKQTFESEVPKRGTIFSPNPNRRSNKTNDHIEGKSYDDHSILHGSVSSDSLFRRWKKDRVKLNSKIKFDKISTIFDVVFPIDRKCKGCLGVSKRPHTLRSSCVGCNLLTRLFERGNESRDCEVSIKTGRNKDKVLSLNHIPYSVDFFSNYEEKFYAKFYGVKVFDTLSGIGSCEQSYASRIGKTRTFATSSLISNYIVISSVLQQEMSISEMPGIPTFKWAYECEDGVTVVEEKLGESGSLSVLESNDRYMRDDKELRSDVTRLILTQLCMNLLFLNNYDFTHGSPSLESIIISPEPCEIEYGSIQLAAPFTVHINPSGYSSMTVGVEDEILRLFYNRTSPNANDIQAISKIDMKASLENKLTFEPCIVGDGKSSMCSKYISSRVLSYKIGRDKSFDFYTKQLGIALFPSSFDTYAFFLSLMVEESFNNSVRSDKGLNKIWESMWQPDELEKLKKSVEELKRFKIKTGKTPTYPMIRETLFSFHLRCDGLKFLWNSLKNLSYME